MSTPPPPATPSFATASSRALAERCAVCAHELEPAAKFCGGCGQPLAGGQAAGTEPVNLVTTPLPPIPTFATVPPLHVKAVPEELLAEADKAMLLLARERAFLVMHYTLFVAVNVLGLLLAIKCYSEFIGDELSKLMMGSTPLMFINSLALMFLVPIKGTRAQIARLEEQIAHIKFKVEYKHLL